MEINEIAVKKSTKAEVPWGDVLIMPFGDIQFGADGVDMDRFKRDFEWGMEHGAYFIGMGDFVDVASPSNRAKIKGAGFYDSVKAALEDSAERHLEDIMTVLRGSEERWLGLHEGHHFWEFEDGTTTDTRLATLLKAPFLGTCALTRVKMVRPRSGQTLTYDIWSHHGAGGGQALAAPLTKLEKVASAFDADMFLINHFQRSGAIPKDWLYVNKAGVLKHKQRYLVATGGYMRGYTQGVKAGGNNARGSYVEQNLMIPTNLGGVKIFLKPNMKQSQIWADVLV